MKWIRVTANLEPDIAAIAKARARQRQQSVAGYLASLIIADGAANGLSRQMKFEQEDLVGAVAEEALRKLEEREKIENSRARDYSSSGAKKSSTRVSKT